PGLGEPFHRRADDAPVGQLDMEHLWTEPDARGVGFGILGSKWIHAGSFFPGGFWLSSFLRSSMSSRSRASKRSAMGSGMLAWSIVASGMRSPPSVLMTRAGTPITVEFAGTDLITTEFAQILNLSTVLIPQRSFAM